MLDVSESARFGGADLESWADGAPRALTNPIIVIVIVIRIGITINIGVVILIILGYAPLLHVHTVNGGSPTTAPTQVFHTEICLRGV